MDIQGKIAEIVDKIKGNPQLLESFKQEPIETIESLIGMDLPDDQLKPIIEGVKAKLNVEKASGLFGTVKKMF